MGKRGYVWGIGLEDLRVLAVVSRRMGLRTKSEAGAKRRHSRSLSVDCQGKPPPEEAAVAE
jgi:hypothetical protein